MISGTTALVAHMGYPTHTFRSSLICNPWFEKNGVDAVVVPMGIKAEDYPDFFRSVFTLTNIRGALITMPHKVTTMELVDEISRTAQISGATNAVLRREDGSLLADQFDGAGFVRGVLRKGFDPSGKRALVVGSGGVGSPIAVVKYLVITATAQLRAIHRVWHFRSRRTLDKRGSAQTACRCPLGLCSPCPWRPAGME